MSLSDVRELREITLEAHSLFIPPTELPTSFPPGALLSVALRREEEGGEEGGATDRALSRHPALTLLAKSG